MFKRFVSHNPPMYNGIPNPKTFMDWIQGTWQLFDALQCPEQWKVGIAILLEGQG